MSTKEIAAKQAAEVDKDPTTGSRAKPRTVREFIDSNRRTERVLAARLLEALGDDYDVRANVRVGNVPVDILLEPRLVRGAVAVEVKFFRGAEAAANAWKRFRELIELSGRIRAESVADTVLAFLVFDSEDAMRRASELPARAADYGVHLIVLTKDRLVALQPETLADYVRDATSKV
jgi:hypothetical protein